MPFKFSITHRNNGEGILNRRKHSMAAAEPLLS